MKVEYQKYYDAISTIFETEGKLNTANYKKQLHETKQNDLKQMKEDLSKRIKHLDALILSAENDVVNHRDTKQEQYGRFWIFSWHERTIHQDNGERAYTNKCNNLKRERQDTQNLLDTINNNNNIIDTLTNIQKEIDTHKAIISTKKEEEAHFKEEVEKLEEEIKKVTLQIEGEFIKKSVSFK